MSGLEGELDKRPVTLEQDKPEGANDWLSGSLTQKVAQERRGWGPASQGRWALGWSTWSPVVGPFMPPSCISLVFSFSCSPGPQFYAFFSNLPHPPPTLPPASMRKRNHSEEKPHRCPPSCTHVLCAPPIPTCEPALPPLKSAVLPAQIPLPLSSWWPDSSHVPSLLRWHHPSLYSASHCSCTESLSCLHTHTHTHTHTQPFLCSPLQQIPVV